jgi:predicted porin
MRGLQSLIAFDDVPYDDRSRIFSIQVAYQLTPRVSVDSSVNYVKSKADFDSMLDSRNVGRYSDLEMSEVETSLGVTFIYTQNISMYARYQFKDYNDRENDYFDGQYSLIGAGLNWSF